MTQLVHSQWPAVDLPAVGSLPDIMGLPPAAADQQSGERYHTFVALNAARRAALHLSDFDIRHDRWIILSDVHKGDRQSSCDEFVHNEELYCRALQYYLERDYRLVLNGDIEEGWKNNLPAVMRAYADTAFEMERRFLRRGRDFYLRIYGNHDSDWADPRRVDRLLRPVLGAPLEVYPAVMLGDRIMIVHGHQGELSSDRRAWFSRRVVRYLWRPLQRHFDLKLRAYSAENALVHSARDGHLSAWAAASRLLVIAGHTHRALFRPLQPGESRLHYLNDGSCLYAEGLTGIEIDRGEIRLITWRHGPPHSPIAAARTLLKSTDLRMLLARL